MQGTGRGTNTKCKSKATVPKPSRGSGLNPSGQPANDQLNIPSERLRMPDNMFDTYDRGGGGQGSHSGSIPPHFTLGDDGNFDIDALYGQAGRQTLTDALRSDPYTDADLPMSRWTGHAPDRGRGEIPSSDVVHTTGPARTVRRVTRQVSMPSTPYAVPRTLVSSDAQSPVAIEVRAGPSVMEPSSSSQPQDITPTKEVRQQIVCKAKHGVVGWLFTKYAMSQTAADRKRLIKKAILDAVPRIFSSTVSFNSLVTKEQYRSVSQALTNARGKIIDIARSGVPHAYELYRPSGYTERTPTQYRVHIATTLTRTGSLTVMHSHHFDPDGNIHVHSHFDHSFIKHVVIRFIWYLRHETFLGESPLTKINYIIAIAVAAVYCVLQEQRMPMPSIDPFTGLVHYNKFVEVIAVLDGLDGEDKKALESFKLDMLEVGPSQMRTNIEADDDDDLLYE
ncbi:uncharacterized protein F5891DRAFT_1201213 [Suillus fuscotomentosus]|uniref:DUF6532 domain-containing protein n=1 Tax=Suillus fuscotomentosus TaxID=1912939 RepID=A0AAD4HD09_9AGAM|nr:uncharacterized protein F5891DRAFT_1201213 [Suillus fuscotomentosus]KAG1886333.1 hypothetical protein F5891DRAFT_1201213 [Suillus fuscotomentosus]